MAASGVMWTMPHILLALPLPAGSSRPLAFQAYFGGRHRPSDTQMRSVCRQPAGGRCGVGGWEFRNGQRQNKSRSLLGNSRRRGKFWRRHLFLFRLHPIDTVYAGPMFWELEQANDVMRWYRDFITHAPEEINGFFAFLVVPPGSPFPEHLHKKKVCGIIWYYAGPMDQAEALSTAFAASNHHFSTWSARYRTRRCRACSIPSIRRGFSGTGRPTSSMN